MVKLGYTQPQFSLRSTMLNRKVKTENPTEIQCGKSTTLSKAEERL